MGMLKFYDEIMVKADPRVEDYFMMSSPVPGIILTLSYFYFVKIGGPKFMENRKPFNIKKILLFYNFAMVALSGYILSEFLLAGWMAGYTLGCQSVDYSMAPQAVRMVNVCWWFMMTKYIELLDTVFFIMRKKYNQVSFLHVLHHGIMPLSWWAGVKFAPGGFGTFHGMLNSWIHFVMYIYYGVAALGPQYQKYLWWKKYMTTMQIVQFVIVCLHTGQLFFIECDYPITFAYMIGSYAFVFLFMFTNFYMKTYRKKEEDTKKEIHANGVNGIKGKAE